MTASADNLKKVFVLLMIFAAGFSPGYASDCGSCDLCNNYEQNSKEQLIAAAEKRTYTEDEIDRISAGTGNTAPAQPKQEEIKQEPENEYSIFGFDYSEYRILVWPVISLLFTILAGIFVRFSPLRKTRGLFLILAIIFLGFYNSACPCPIMSVQTVFLGGIGVEVNWLGAVWFLALIPITYIFGKTWCGWICHLGALQEFLHFSDKLRFLSGKKAQLVMKYMRYVLVAALFVQLIITQTNLFCKIDPFKTAFNLGFNTDLTGWILLGLILLTSLFIERPFCKAVCPIGLILGWTTKIPGASVLGDKGSCTDCKSCAKSCQMDAIEAKNGYHIVDNQECIACGDCLESCNRGSIGFFRKSNKHASKAVLAKNNFPEYRP